MNFFGSFQRLGLDNLGVFVSLSSCVAECKETLTHTDTVTTLVGYILLFAVVCTHTHTHTSREFNIKRTHTHVGSGQLVFFCLVFFRGRSHSQRKVQKVWKHHDVATEEMMMTTGLSWTDDYRRQRLNWLEAVSTATSVLKETWFGCKRRQRRKHVNIFRLETQRGWKHFDLNVWDFKGELVILGFVSSFGQWPIITSALLKISMMFYS